MRKSQRMTPLKVLLERYRTLEQIQSNRLQIIKNICACIAELSNEDKPIDSILRERLQWQLEYQLKLLQKEDNEIEACQTII